MMVNYILFERFDEYEFGFFVDMDTQEIRAIAVNHAHYQVREIGTFLSPEEAVHKMNCCIQKGFSIGGFTFTGEPGYISEVLI